MSTTSNNEIPRITLLPEVANRHQQKRRKPLYGQPKPQRPAYGRIVSGIVIIGLLAGLYWLGNWTNPTVPIADDIGVVVTETGQEIPADHYIATHTVSNPKVTDLRSKDGRNGMLYEELKSGPITRLWRDRDDEYIHVQFANGQTGKCSELQKLNVGESAWACFTHVKQYDSGWARQDFIAFEAKVPQAQLASARRIQRGATGDLRF